MSGWSKGPDVETAFGCFIVGLVVLAAGAVGAIFLVVLTHLR